MAQCAVIVQSSVSHCRPRSSPFAALSCGLLASCSGQARPVVALDEAFAASRPALAAPPGRPGFGPGPSASSAGPCRSRRADGGRRQGARRRDSRAKEKRKARASWSRAPSSPRPSCRGRHWTGDPPFIVPEWRGKPERPGLWTALPTRCRHIGPRARRRAPSSPPWPRTAARPPAASSFPKRPRDPARH